MVMPLREYYPVARAADLLGCKVEDLLHWASIGAINLYVEFDEGKGYVIFHNDSQELRDKYLSEITPVGDGPFIINKMYSSENRKIQEFFKAKPPSDNFIPCLFRGFLALPYEFFGYSKIHEIKPSFDDIWFSPNKQMLIFFESDEYIRPEIDEIYLMKSDFIRLSIKKSKKCEYDDEARELPNYYNGGIERPEIEVIDSGKKQNVSNYHAQKRESVLKAAIYMMLNHSELCENNIKWAEAIDEYAHKFWDSGEMPLSVKVVAELLGKAKSSLK